MPMINGTEFYYPNNLTRIEQIWTYNNHVTQNIFGFGMIFVIFVVLMFWLKGFYTTERSFAGASFGTFLITLPMFILGIVPEYVLYIFIFMTAVSVFFLIKGD